MNKNFVLFAVYDRLSGQYGAPQLAVNGDTAIRSCKVDFANSKIKEDLELYVLGTYDPETAEIVCTNKPELIYKFKEDEE